MALRISTVVLAAALGVALLSGGAAASTDRVIGYWETQNRGAIVEFGPCGTHVCGRMVWLREPRDATGAPKRDAEGRPLCGISLVTGLERARSGRWEDGKIYDPRSGKHYSAEVEVTEEGTLRVRGYALARAFGRSQIWQRAGGDRGGC